MDGARDGAVDELRERYDEPLPESVEALPADDARDLAAAMSESRRRLRRELSESTDASLAQLPGALRALIKRVLGL
ncbi:hypothetical protein [Actinokineospora pegani]|uniref:hypothetical protein n=1 Tax=Actinokineospora pegani TaxID=2654637 RepID=UPI0012E9DD1A|nr:hypothetical protein [Actinokineospora pegani]